MDPVTQKFLDALVLIEKSNQALLERWTLEHDEMMANQNELRERYLEISQQNKELKRNIHQLEHKLNMMTEQAIYLSNQMEQLLKY